MNYIYLEEDISLVIRYELPMNLSKNEQMTIVMYFHTLIFLNLLLSVLSFKIVVFSVSHGSKLVYKVLIQHMYTYTDIEIKPIL